MRLQEHCRKVKADRFPESDKSECRNINRTTKTVIELKRNMKNAVIIWRKLKRRSLSKGRCIMTEYDDWYNSSIGEKYYTKILME